MTRKLVIMIGLLALGLSSSAMAAKQQAASGGLSPTMIGPRLGFSVDPDQFVVGGHLSTGFARNWTLNPSLEVGFGDGETVTSLNFDAQYHFKIQGSTWSPYAGFGMGIHFVHVDASSPFEDVNDTASGLNFIIGTQIPTASSQHIFTELRIGTGDSMIPELKGIFGWNFRL